MNDTTTLSVRIDSDIKKQAEMIMAQLGMTPSGVIQMLYRQIIYMRGLPFNVRLPDKPIAIGGMSDEEVLELADEGKKSAEQGTYSQDDLDEIFEEKYGVKRKKR